MALTTPRDTNSRSGKVREFKVAAGARIFTGSLVAIDAAGNLNPASDTAGLKVWGRASQDADNTNGLAGDLTCKAARGVFCYNNSTSDAVVPSKLLTQVFVEDDETVTSDEGNGVIAGVALEIDDEGVWVDTTQTFTTQIF